MKNTFKEGEIVHERIRPAQKLIVMRCMTNLYYCQPLEHASRRDLVYLESELMSDQIAPVSRESFLHALVSECWEVLAKIGPRAKDALQ